MLNALLLALRQIPDPAFRRPLILGALGALAGLAGLAGLSGWVLAAVAGAEGWFAAAAAAAGVVLVGVAAWWLFIPLLLAISGLFLDGVAAAVERRHYPALPSPAGAPATAQAWWAAVLAAKMAGLTLILLPLSLLLPLLGFLALWAVAAIGLGEGLFLGVALRRMDRPAAEALRRRRRGEIWSLGAALALLAAVPLVNLLVPVLGTAAMTHLLHRAG
ncbi:EI24 domain-containing protein [Falsiroseomonas selenitidurans]|uniref:Cysteine biosynthesis protein CysZ n=1 Tax=Falsiroseomonas selenitidurans TaxID=2716335 RepID=A0ABX1EI35_9PROT|nr:EI24 domain-containing protein [Falsiroseomonas selenitidurans]NKC34525.1 cysteine biosynthesis protein CysZ [Falsiroseomonas selenitidurans]